MNKLTNEQVNISTDRTNCKLNIDEEKINGLEKENDE